MKTQPSFATFIKALIAALVAACACTALAQAPAKISNGVLTNSKGMTLYTTDRDTPNSGKSVCFDRCAEIWPPFIAKSSDKPKGDYTIITREDGSKQWAYKGKPLYLWVKDKKPGDKGGDGLNNVWHAATP